MIRSLVAVMTVLTTLSCTRPSSDFGLAGAVPQGADVIVFVDVATLRHSAALRQLLAHPALAPATGPLERELARCGTRLEAVDEFVLGMHTPTRNWLIALQDGELAEPAIAACLSGGLTRVVSGQATKDNRASVWLGERDTLTLASPGWADAVAQRRQGQGAAAMTTNVARAMERVNPRLPVWLAIDLRVENSPIASALTFEHVDHIAGTMSFGDNVDFSFYLVFSEPAAAQATYDRFADPQARPGSRLERTAEMLLANTDVKVDDEVIGIAGYLPPGAVSRLLIDEAESTNPAR